MKKVKIGKSGKFLVVDDENFELVNNIDNRIYIYKIKQCKNEN